MGDDSIARRRLGCPCNCHEAWWTEHGKRRHATCRECIAALREERRHLRAIERAIGQEEA